MSNEPDDFPANINLLNETGRIMLNAKKDSVFILNPITGKAILWNIAFVQLSAYSAAEIGKLNILETFFSQSQQVQLLALIERVKKEGSGKIELEFITKSNEKIRGEYQATLAKFTGEDQDNIIFVGRDLTQSRQIENELLQNKLFVDKIIESSAVSTWISDENGTAIQTNPACLEFFGATNDEVIGKYNVLKDEVLIREGMIDEVKEVFEKGVVKNISFDYNFTEVNHVDVKNATHKYINTIFTPILNNLGKVENVIVQTFDLSEIKKAEEKLRHSEERFRTLIEHAPEAIVVFDLDKGVFVDANKNALELFKVSYEEILKMNPGQLSPKFQPNGELSETAAKQKLEKAIQGETPVFEWVHVDASNQEKYCELRLVHLPPFSKKLVRGSITDISERKKYEEEIKRYRDKLEKLVQERTAELEEKNKELDKTLKVFVGRELQIRELRNQIKILKGE